MFSSLKNWFEKNLILRYYLAMRQSQLFTKTRKEAPKDEIAKNAQLLIRAGYIYKEMAGVYAYLPLGIRVLEKIKQIVREQMNAINSQELIMTALQRKELWERTSRWDDEVVDVWFKSELKDGGAVGFGWSHEEPIGEMMKNYISSYKDMPISVYQFQTKLRNEKRAKSGIMRGREFVMKDMYSFFADEQSHIAYYESCKPAYMNVFKRLGLGDDTFITFAAGGAFTKFSHEFQTICEAGEDVVYINRAKNIAINEEVLTDETLKELNVSRDELEKVNTAEVGNIFNFGQQKAIDLGLSAKDASGNEIPVWIGSYGIGITRLMGVLVEKFSDEKGIVWPEAVSPFKVHLVVLGDDQKVKDEAEKLYNDLVLSKIEVLFDDRVGVSNGEKLNDADLLGMPIRVLVSEKSLSAGGCEYKKRNEKDSAVMSFAEVLDFLK